MRALSGTMLLGFVLVVTSGCAGTPEVMAPHPARPSGASPFLEEVASAEPPPGHRSLLVAYPKTPCTGSARTVFVDGDGTFFGAVAPGEATILTIPTRLPALFAISSVEIVAPAGTRFVFEEVDVARVPDSLVLEGLRANARQCGTSGHYASAEPLSKREMEDRLAEAEIAWMEPKPREGQAWIESHRPRVDEILGRKPIERPIVVGRGHP